MRESVFSSSFELEKVKLTFDYILRPWCLFFLEIISVKLSEEVNSQADDFEPDFRLFYRLNTISPSCFHHFRFVYWYLQFRCLGSWCSVLANHLSGSHSRLLAFNLLQVYVAA